MIILKKNQLNKKNKKLKNYLKLKLLLETPGTFLA